VIVRISTEGQYELAEEDRARLEELDLDAVSACEGDDEKRFQAAFERLLAYVRERGRPIADDELVGSDLILPPPDVSLAEARAEFQGEGLIPG